jgi:hypothetical protein
MIAIRGRLQQIVDDCGAGCCPIDRALHEMNA